jgi:hypothetical protein
MNLPGQSLVLIPHARTAHQPRIASKSEKPPKQSKKTPAHVDERKTKPAAINRARAKKPRTRRPLLLIFGVKNRFIRRPF